MPVDIWPYVGACVGGLVGAVLRDLLIRRQYATMGDFRKLRGELLARIEVAEDDIDRTRGRLDKRVKSDQAANARAGKDRAGTVMDEAEEILRRAQGTLYPTPVPGEQPPPGRETVAQKRARLAREAATEPSH